jgi:flagellar basal body rod protein FlgC
MDLSSAMTIAAAGMQVQSARLQITAENLANAESTGLVAGGSISPQDSELRPAPRPRQRS